MSAALHAASLGAVGLCLTLWIRAKTVGQEERGNAERRALFVELWPPRLWLLGDIMREFETRQPDPGSESVREMVLGDVDVAAALAGLRGLGVNYDEADAPTRGRPENWHVGHPRTFIAREPAGPPVPGGAWRIACALVGAYEFSDPALVRAVYQPDEELLVRDLLLEGRFLALRFQLGVRGTEVVDETRDDERVWGWGYQTLEGHLEQGKLVYEVVKNLHTRAVELRIRAYSRRASIPNPIVRWGSSSSGGEPSCGSTPRWIGGCASQCRRFSRAGTRRRRR